MPHAAPAPAPLPADAPPNVRPGECYARLTTPGRVEHRRERVLVEEGRVDRRELPPRIETERRTVVVRPEQRRTHHVPPVYETVTETQLIRPGGEQRYVEPAEVRTVAEVVPAGPPRRVWRFVDSPLQPGPVWCLVEEPGPTTVVHREVVVRPETVRVVVTPPEYRTVHKQVVKVPGGLREEVVPAETREEVVERVVEPGRVEERRVEPRFKEVVTKVVSPARQDWTPVLCEAAATPHKIKAIQAALKRSGHYAGPVDGLYGPATADAVRRFQAARGVPHQGYLSRATLAALGVPFDQAPRSPRG
jgi:hypothetical protein